MTTAFAYAVRGELRASFQAQPAGLVLAMLCLATGSVALCVSITGRFPRLPLGRLSPQRVFFVLLLVVLGGWAYKLLTGSLAGLPSPGAS
jgi:hypothetical protein